MTRTLDEILAQFSLQADAEPEARRAYEQFVADYLDAGGEDTEVIEFDVELERD